MPSIGNSHILIEGLPHLADAYTSAAAGECVSVYLPVRH